VIVLRSTGDPNTVTPPGRHIEFAVAMSRKSRCRAAGIRVVSAFQ
jgi:hypothetical protein